MVEDICDVLDKKETALQSSRQAMAIVPTITTMKCSNIQMNLERYTFEPIWCFRNTKNRSAIIDTRTSAPGWAAVTVLVDIQKCGGGFVTTFVTLERMGREVYDVVGEKIAERSRVL